MEIPRVFDVRDWEFMSDNTTDSFLAEVMVSTQHFVYQLSTGDVIVVRTSESDGPAMVVFPGRYPDALLYLSETARAL